jgi:superfamily II DNA or RNA helicase
MRHQEVFRLLADDVARTEAIAAEVRAAVAQGRKVLVLTERTNHIGAILSALGEQFPRPFVLHGRLSGKQRAAVMAQLACLETDAPRVVLATGKLVGEGFDHPPLDTLILAMPVSWKGTLQQYAGRLHREHAACESSTSSTAAIPRCCGCGRSACADTERWGIG